MWQGRRVTPVMITGLLWIWLMLMWVVDVKVVCVVGIGRVEVCNRITDKAFLRRQRSDQMRRMCMTELGST